MATFSRGFLSQLGQPAMSQSLFNLGSALGSVPGAMKAKRKREERYINDYIHCRHRSS